MRTINKNIHIAFILVILVLFFSGLGAAAQVKSTIYSIYCQVADSITKQPLGYVTVRLKTDTNNSAQIGFTKPDGSFSFTVMAPLKYTATLTLVATGYQDKVVTVNFTDTANRNRNLGVLYMGLKVNSLKEVSITADKPIITQKPGRIIYDLQADPESKANNVLGMMHKVPFISVDGEGNILLKGNPSFKVLINGKPSGMMEQNLKDILRSMPASTIQSIEVITVPSAKYDLEGLAGIINIITNKRTSDGYNGTININEHLPVGGPGVGGSFTVKQGKLGISAFTGGNIYNTPETGNSYNRTTTGTNPTSLIQSGTNKTDTRTGYFGTELSYELDSLNLITGQFSLHGNKSTGQDAQSSLLTDQSGILQQYNLNNINKDNGNGVDASLNYQLGFKADKNRLLTFSYRYSTNSNNQTSNIDVVNLINFPTPDFRQNNQDKSVEQTVQVDYIYPVKNLTIEAGLKGIFRNNKSDYQYLSLDPGDNQFDLDPALSDQFNYTQNVFSAYNTYELNLKSWSFNGGVRLEQTVINADFLTDNSNVNQNYLTAVPSISINKSFTDGNSLNFGFTERIKRPGINRLNPFVDRSNPTFESTGNPGLRPVLFNDIQLGYNISKKLNVNIGLDYSFLNNADLPVSTFNPATNVTLTTFENSGKVKGLSSFLYMNYPVTNNWNISLNGNLIYFWIQGVANGVVSQQELLTYYTDVSTGYAFTKGWRLTADLSVISRNPTGFQGTSNGFIMSSVNVNKEIVKNKLSFAAIVNNPFTKYRNNQSTTTGPGFFQTSTNQNYYRTFNISLNYKFGGLKGSIKKSKQMIKNDDLSNKKDGM
jgi:ferric enterobactin receptor